MGGIDPVAPKKSEEEIRAGAIAAGQNCEVPNPHTVFVVNNPSAATLFYAGRSDIDNICYAVPIDHLSFFKWSPIRMERYNTTFYAYKDRESAMEDALQRLAMVGMRCRLCHGVAHPASGCQYTSTFLVCGTCIQPYTDVMKKVPKAGLIGWIQNWTAAKSSKKLTERFPGAKGFYESAGLFSGQDQRKLS